MSFVKAFKEELIGCYHFIIITTIATVMFAALFSIFEVLSNARPFIDALLPNLIIFSVYPLIIWLVLITWFSYEDIKNPFPKEFDRR